MTSHATFGDFIRAVDEQLAGAHARHGTQWGPTALPGEPAEVRDVMAALRRVVAVMTRYARQFTGAQVPAHDRPMLDSWGRASVDAREALENANALLQDAAPGNEWPAGKWAGSPLAERLRSTALLLATGHDLLGTHVVTAPDGTQRGHSDWAPVIRSVPVSRAVLSEIGSLGGLVASQTTRMALTRRVGQHDTEEARRNLNAACQWLWIAIASVQYANLTDPVPDEARDLLHAIPVNAREPRSAPRGGESIRDLCYGAILSAERIRHATRTLARDAAWAPTTSGTSLRHAAGASTATSYHCEILLRTLADHPDLRRSCTRRIELLAAADALSGSRAAWLRSAHVWDQLTIDSPKVLSHAAAESSDLALWTGRLAFADPGWTLARGPSRDVRPPEKLAADRDDIPRIIAAVHHASETMTRLAGADHQQIMAAARAHRLLVPTSTMPEDYDIPHPMTRAPASRIETALATYRDTAAVSFGAAAELDSVAASNQAPSMLLTAARTITGPSRAGRPSLARSREFMPTAPAPDDARSEALRPPASPRISRNRQRLQRQAADRTAASAAARAASMTSQEPARSAIAAGRPTRAADRAASMPESPRDRAGTSRHSRTAVRQSEPELEP